MPKIFLDPEIDSAAHTRSIPGLDGLRALSILIVMVSHSGLQRLIPGVFGVTIFFFISGFLITNLLIGEYGRTDDVNIARFYMRRILRLYPPLLAYIATVLLVVVATGHNIDSIGLLGALFYFANYLYALAPDHLATFGVHLWSLSVEEHFYLVFPALYLFLARSERDFLFLAVLCIAALLIRTFIAGPSGLHEVYTSVATECRFDTILSGCITAVIVNARYRVKFISFVTHPLTVAVALFVILITMIYRDPVFRQTMRYTLQNLALMSLVTSAVYTPRYLALKWLLNCRIARWIGVLSYSLYLWHVAAFEVTLSLIQSQSVVVGYLMGWVATFTIAAMIYWAIERPIFTLRRRFGSRTHEGVDDPPPHTANEAKATATPIADR